MNWNWNWIIYIVILVIACLRFLYDTRSTNKAMAYLLFCIFIPFTRIKSIMVAYAFIMAVRSILG